MAWATPKTDWATSDAIGTTDLNRIEENTRVLYATSWADYSSGTGAIVLTANDGTSTFDRFEAHATIVNAKIITLEVFFQVTSSGGTVQWNLALPSALYAATRYYESSNRSPSWPCLVYNPPADATIAIIPAVFHPDAHTIAISSHLGALISGDRVSMTATYEAAS
jgi:hypothetical protein